MIFFLQIDFFQMQFLKIIVTFLCLKTLEEIVRIKHVSS